MACVIFDISTRTNPVRSIALVLGPLDISLKYVGIHQPARRLEIMDQVGTVPLLSGESTRARVECIYCR
jgi:hypothetical protein